MEAIKGEKIEFTSTQLNALVGAIRIVSDDILPADFYNTSVCGKLPTDYNDDIGECILKKIRQLTEVLFDEGTLLYRLLKPLQEHFEKQCKRRRKNSKKVSMISMRDILCDEQGEKNELKGRKSKSASRAGAKRKKKVSMWSIPEHCADLLSQALQLSALGAYEEEREERIPWNSRIRNISTKNDLGQKVFKLYKSLLQGPVTHMIRKTDIDSAYLLADSCIQNDATAFLKEMMAKDRFNAKKERDTKKEGEELGSTSNIAETLRLLTGGLVSAGIIDKDTTEHVPSEAGLLPLLGNVLKGALRVVEDFYAYYEAQQGEEVNSAAEYQKKWALETIPR